MIFLNCFDAKDQVLYNLKNSLTVPSGLYTTQEVDDHYSWWPLWSVDNDLHNNEEADRTENCTANIVMFS